MTIQIPNNSNAGPPPSSTDHCSTQTARPFGIFFNGDMSSTVSKCHDWEISNTTNKTLCFPAKQYLRNLKMLTITLLATSPRFMRLRGFHLSVQNTENSSIIELTADNIAFNNVQFCLPVCLPVCLSVCLSVI